MNGLGRFEGNILLFIQNHIRCALLNGPMYVVSRLGDAGLIWIAVTLLLLAMKRTRRIGVASAIALLTGVLATNLVLKPLIHRTRPYEVFEALRTLVPAERDYSFPSGHSTSSFAAGWAIFRVAPKKYGSIALALAICIAISRLYVGVHYPTDVLAGIAIGIVAAEIGVRAVRSRQKKQIV